MSSLTSSSLLPPVWDGRCLTLHALPAATLGVVIDGSRFIDLVAGEDGSAKLELAFSPSGNACLALGIATGDAGHAAFGVELGQPGLHAVVASPQPLRSLGTGERLVPPDALPMQREVAIVVPVYNAPDDVERCLDSVLAHTTGPSRLIVIDDASTDARIAPLLDRYRGIAGVDILANAQNLGFTATVNRGIALAGEADVVLLNADAEVAASWLTGLRRALHAADDIATVTAVSDNAGAFSVPELERENPLPAAWTFAETALALWQDAGLAYPQLPTGNGFCMLIRREVIAAIGAFDVAAFPQGYGEENDFCQRACAAGYRHLIAGNVLVRHARSRSFGHERREALGRTGMQVLRERWPRYEADVGAQLFSFERRVLDWRVRRIHAEAASRHPRPRALCLAVADGILAPSGYDTLMLTPSIRGFALGRRGDPPLETSEQLDARTASTWLQRHAIDRVVLAQMPNDPVSSLLAREAIRLGVALQCGGHIDADASPGFCGIPA